MNGLTPAEKWNNVEMKTRNSMRLDCWDGVLAGYYFRN